MLILLKRVADKYVKQKPIQCDSLTAQSNNYNDAKARWPVYAINCYTNIGRQDLKAKAS